MSTTHNTHSPSANRDRLVEQIQPRLDACSTLSRAQGH